jgi:hypothetical protein
MRIAQRIVRALGPTCVPGPTVPALIVASRASGGCAIGLARQAAGLAGTGDVPASSACTPRSAWASASLSGRSSDSSSEASREHRRLKGTYAAGAQAYEPHIPHIFAMADMISGGMIEQFPARFR